MDKAIIMLAFMLHANMQTLLIPSIGHNSFIAASDLRAFAQ